MPELLHLTLREDRMMPGYFYTRAMEDEEDAGEGASSLPRHSCDVDPRWPPSLGLLILMLIYWFGGQPQSVEFRQIESLNTGLIFLFI